MFMTPVASDLLVSYPYRRFGPARREIRRILKRLGDEHVQVERTGVDGVAFVRTALDGREVVRRCRELFQTAPTFEFAIKWVPVDYWCDTDLDAMRKLIEEKIRGQIDANETWGMKVERRGWPLYHTAEIIARLAAAIDRRVDLDRPDKLVRIDIVGRQTAISVLRPGDIFSVTAPT